MYVVRPHRYTKHMMWPITDVPWSVCHNMNCDKTAETVHMPFGVRVLGGSPDPRREGAVLRGISRPIMKYREYLM